MKLSERARLGVVPEHREYRLRDVEIRDNAEGGDVTFEGVASVVDKPYTVRDRLGEYEETIAAGAFNKTLRDSNIALYVNHRWDDVPLATTAAQTLSLRATPDLAVSASLDPVRSDVVIARSAVRRGELTQMSVGMSVPKDKQTWNEDYTKRTIHEAKLIEVSIVMEGVNPFTSASVRSANPLMALQFAKRAAPSGAMSYGDISSLVCDAVCDGFEQMGMTECYIWIDDLGPDWAVYCTGMGDYYQVSYSIDAAGNVTLGEAFEVARQTLYTPVTSMESALSAAEEVRLLMELHALNR